MISDHIPEYLKHTYSLYNREKKHDIINNCNNPEKTLSIDNQGNCFVCSCDGWLPVSVGHILDFNSIEEVWQSPVAKELQKDIMIDKKFTHCSVDYCGIKNYNCIGEDYYISINIDESCNLQCPTCRNHFINFTSGNIYENKLSWSEHIKTLLSKFKQSAQIVMSGNGDPFASLIYRPLILNTIPFSKHRYKIMTNGLLLRKLLKQTAIYPNITEYSISIDAGDAETYEKIRVRGKWNVLIENLDFLKEELKDRSNISVNLNFCLQQNNVRSLKNFADLAEHYDWTGTVHPLEDWATYKNFKEHDILDPAHKLHEEMINELNSIASKKNINIQSKLKNYINSI